MTDGTRADYLIAMLAALDATPDDLGARRALGEWLAERGNPQGELIRLQLERGTAGRVTPRERALITEHRRRWAGVLDPCFELEGRRFEHGFFAGGMLRAFSDRALLRHPAWGLVRVLESRWPDTEGLLLSLIRESQLRSLRAIHRVTEGAAAKIAEGQPLAITTLHAHGGGDDFRGVRSPLRRCSALPHLRVLGLVNVDHTVRMLTDAPILDRLDRLVVNANHYLQPLLEMVATRQGPRTIELASIRGMMDEQPWRVLLQRDHAPGPFTRLTIAAGRPARTIDLVANLLAVPHSIPTSWLRELTIVGRSRIKPQDRAEILELLARFDALTVTGL